MTKTVGQEMSTNASIAAITQAGYPTSNVLKLYRQLTAQEDSEDDNLKGYRDLFAEFVAQGNVTHDASILSPAAYLMDLLRMVDHLTNRRPISSDRRLSRRRPDIWEIPLGPEETTTEHRYLDLINETILKPKIFSKMPRRDKADAQLLELFNHDGDLSRSVAYLECAGIRPSSIADLFRKDTETGLAADLRCSLDILNSLLSPESHLNFISKCIARSGIKARIRKGEALQFLKGAGINDEVIALALQPDHQGLSGLQSMIAKQLGKDTARLSASADGTLSAAYVAKSKKEKSLDATPDQLVAALSEIIRFTRLAKALRLNPRELDHLLSILENPVGLDKEIAAIMAVRDLWKRSRLSLCEAVLAFGCPADPMMKKSEQPSLLQELFGSKIESVHWNDVPSSMGETAGLPPADVEAIALRVWVAIHDPKGNYSGAEMLHEAHENPLIPGEKLAPILFRLAKLKDLLGRPVDELLDLADMLGTGLSKLEDIRELISMSDWLDSTGVAFGQIREMTQAHSIPDCAAEDVAALRAAARSRLDGLDAGDEAGRSHACLASLAEVLKLAADDLDPVLKLGVAKDRLEALLRALRTDDGTLDVDKAGRLPSNDAVLGFCDAQSCVLAARTFGATAKAVLHEATETAVTIDAEKVSSWRKIRSLRQMHRVQTLVDARGDDVLSWLESIRKLRKKGGRDRASVGQFAELVAKIAGIAAADARHLITAESRSRKDAFPNPLGAAETLLDFAERLIQIGKMANRLSVTAKQLRDIAGLFSKDVSLNREGPGSGAALKRRKELAGLTVAAVTGSMSSAEIAEKAEKAGASCAEARRDALVGSLMFAQNVLGHDSLPTPFGKLTSLREISDVLLVDLEMGGTAKISRLKLALNSVQRYIQRVQMNREGHPRPFHLGKEDWAWRSHYRVWEANRKVFLFPENYLDPGLRRNKTPLFEQLEASLQQGEIDEDSVQRAYLQYLDGLEELSELEVISAAACDEANPGDESTRNSVYLLARTRAKKPDYYLRRVNFIGCELSTWDPWQKITLPTHTTNMIVGFAHGRVHLFWTETRTVRDQHGDHRNARTYVTVNFSYRTHSGGWSDPRTLDNGDDVFIGMVESGGAAGKKNSDTTPKPEFPFPETDPQVRFSVSAEAPSPANLGIPASAKEPPEGASVSVRMKSELDLGVVKLRDVLEKHPDPINWANPYVPVSEWTVHGDIPCPPSSKEKASGVEMTHLTRVTSKKVVALVRRAGSDSPRRVVQTKDGIDWELDPTMKFPSDTTIEGMVAASDENIYVYGIRTDRERGGRIPYVGYYYHNGRRWIQQLFFQSPFAGNQHVFGFQKLAVDRDGYNFMGLVSAAIQTDFWRSETIGTRFDGSVIYTDSDGEWRSGSEADTEGSYTDLCFAADGSSIAARKKLDKLGKVTDRELTRGTFFGNKIGDRSFWSYDPELGDCQHLTRFDDGRLFAALGRHVYVSEDHGQSWAPFIDRPLEEDILGFNETPFGVAVTTGKGVLWVGKDVSNSGYRRMETAPQLQDGVTGLVTIGDRGQLIMATRKYGAATSSTCRVVSLLRHGVKDGAHLGIHWLKNGRETHPCSEPFSTPAIRELGKKLINEGLDGLLGTKTQSAQIDTDFNGKKVPLKFSLQSAFGSYYRELFFHIPYLIADTLSRNQKFELAKKWYNFVFQPELIGEHDGDDDNPFWKYIPFKSYELRHLKSFSPQELALYEEDPFDAFAISGIRLGAFEKAVVMRYIDNLLDWGDHLFAQDSWETITRAMMLYQQASDLLGPDPRSDREKAAKRNAPTMKEIKAKKFESGHQRPSALTFHPEDRTFFPIPANSTFQEYWDRTYDRMAKIRASEDIRGIKRQLATFQPPIDPRKIMQALASGASVSAATEFAASTPPRFRFQPLVARARARTEDSIRLGEALLAAIERKDSEGLADLRMTQERAVLDEIAHALEMAVDDAVARRDTIEQAQRAADARNKHYAALIESDLISPEKTALKQKEIARDITASTMAIRTAAAVGYAIPTVYGLANGGADPGRVIDTGAAALDAGSSYASQKAGLADARAGNDRRKSDWEWQEMEAQSEIDRLELEHITAENVVAKAQADLDRHTSVVERHHELQAYMDGKFTNRVLHGWMVGQLTSLYFRSFKLALDLARDAQAAFEFERNMLASFISMSPLQSIQGGLLAGQELLLQLSRMEKSWMDLNATNLEISKTISLKALGSNWEDIKTGTLPFSLTEDLFKSDRQGDCLRRIKSVEVTLPAIIHPYQSLDGILTQRRSTQYRNGKATMVESGARIAISHGIEDSGQFEPGVASETYRPFEGTGAVSDWTLSLPVNRADSIVHTLSDVIIHVKYTAEAKG